MGRGVVVGFVRFGDFLPEPFGGKKKAQLNAGYKSLGFLFGFIGGKEKIRLDAGSKTRWRFLYGRTI
ncbi:MAG TPA: hypothetical protein VJH92_05810 [Candidatus Nanoarchaeia archaeon]|nr:hypothetical protein [Candidatus Nanoarchaeia archaeon]